MKRDTCIETIKNQINAKITAKTISDQDYIVFRPKCSLFNPIFNSPNNKNLTSIFQLENKRKNPSAFMKFRFDEKTRLTCQESISSNLKIQKCQTSKKFQTNNDKQKKTLRKFYLGTFRQRTIQTSNEKLGRIKNTASLRKQKREIHQIMFGLQRQKNNQSMNENLKNSREVQQKENSPKPLIFHRLKRISKDEQGIEKSSLSIYKQKGKNDKKLSKQNKRFKESHKRIFTEIPCFLQPKYGDRFLPKNCRNNLPQQNELRNRKTVNVNEDFKPWETGGWNDSHEQILHE